MTLELGSGTTRSETFDRQDAMAEQRRSVLAVDGYSQHGKVWKHDLPHTTSHRLATHVNKR